MKCYREDRDCRKDCALYMPKIDKCTFAMTTITLVAILKALKNLETSLDAYLYQEQVVSFGEEEYLG